VVELALSNLSEVMALKPSGSWWAEVWQQSAKEKLAWKLEHSVMILPERLALHPSSVAVAFSAPFEIV
jgi:hypothetical protein